MNNHAQKLVKYFSVACLSLLSIGCATTNTSMSKPVEPASSMEIYEVHHDGRLHVFYDRKLYKEFLELGETPFRLTRIGDGPKGETIVFGLTKKDKKKPDSVDAIKIYDKKIKAPKDLNFKGEDNKSVLYLVSCWPINTDWKRIVIKATSIDIE